MILHTIGKTRSHYNGVSVKLIEIRFPVVEAIIKRFMEYPDFQKDYSELKLGWVGKFECLYTILVGKRNQFQKEFDVFVYQEGTVIDCLTYKEKDSTIRLNAMNDFYCIPPYDVRIAMVNEIMDCITVENAVGIENMNMRAQFPSYIQAFRDVGRVQTIEGEFIFHFDTSLAD